MPSTPHKKWSIQWLRRMKHQRRHAEPARQSRLIDEVASSAPRRDSLAPALIQRFRGLFIVLICLVGAAHAESVKMLVQSSPLAGSQYYALSEVWAQIRVGDRLALVREAQNRHDRLAVRVEWRGQQLGYVPRAENRAVARALDAGEALEARVSRLREDADPWRRVEFEIFIIL